MGVKNFCSIAFCIFLALISQPIHDIYSRHFRINKDKVWSSDRWRSPNTTWIEKSIPTTYYKAGKLDEVTPPGGWVKNALTWEKEFMLYRLDKGEPAPEIPWKTFDTEARATRIDQNCEFQGRGVFGQCPQKDCFLARSKHSMVNMQNILSDKEEDNYYASFSVLNPQTAQELKNAFQGMPFSFSDVFFESSFISNLKRRIVTAPLHSNPISSSAAIQFLGTKTWLFFDPEEFLAEDGFRAAPTAVVTFPTQAPKKDVVKYYLYESQPGDVMTFPNNFAHVVITDSGPNIMVNLRRVGWQNFWQTPSIILHSLFNMVFYNEVLESAEVHFGNEKTLNVGTAKEFKALPEKEYVMWTAKEVFWPVCDDQDENNIDNILARIAF